MARVDIPLPGEGKDYNSKKSRATLINLMVEQNADGSFKSIKKREGLTTFAATPTGEPIISNLISDELTRVWFSGDTNLFEYQIATSTVVNLGAHGLAAATYIEGAQNTSKPGPGTQNHKLFYNFNGGGVVYDGVITAIADVDFTAQSPRSITFSSNRFWFSGDSDIFFGSDPGTGLAYNPLTVGAADEAPGLMVAVKAIRSNLWIFTESNAEYWQAFSDPNLPLRRVQGASLNVGATRPHRFSPVEKIENVIFFLANDMSLREINGTNAVDVSGLDYKLKLAGDGTTELPDKGVELFVSSVDSLIHKYFIVTSRVLDPLSPTAGIVQFTYVYDAKTGLGHYRTSPDEEYWKGFKSVAFTQNRVASESEKIVMMTSSDSFAGIPDDNVYRLDSNVYTDDGDDFDCILQTDSLSFDKDATISFIEIEMETGVGNVDSTDPEMTVEYSKDGGVNFITWGTVKLGGSTDQSNRIRMNNFGRLVRYRDFILKLTITEPVRVEFYGAYADISFG